MAENDEVEFERHIIVSANTLVMQYYYNSYVHKNPCMTSSQTGYRWVMEVLQGHPNRCYNEFRMHKEVFHSLCSDLETKFGVLGSSRTSHIEVVGLTLNILGRGCGFRAMAERFQHSVETVSRYFGQALDMLCSYGGELIKPLDPEFKSVAPEILKDKRYMPHFKDCVGAIDGVHIPASISPQDQIPYIGRKGIPTQNIMAACDFNMQFIFACAGWEGSAHDTRVFQSVLRDPKWEFPKPPEGKYYVVDAGYPQVKGFLGPYKGPKQHFQEYRGREPRNEEEVFNQAHSSLRGVIERTFGAWKKKWHILRNMEGYSFKKQVRIFVATMTLHNYIRRHANHDRDFDIDEDPVDISRDGTGMDEADDENNGHVAQEMEILRKEIAQSLIRARSNRNF